MVQLKTNKCIDCGAEFQVYPQHVTIKKRCNACQNQFNIDKSTEHNRKKRAAEKSRIKEEENL